jgi:hypothetical protein
MKKKETAAVCTEAVVKHQCWALQDDSEFDAIRYGSHSLTGVTWTLPTWFEPTLAHHSFLLHLPGHTEPNTCIHVCMHEKSHCCNTNTAAGPSSPDVGWRLNGVSPPLTTHT